MKVHLYLKNQKNHKNNMKVLINITMIVITKKVLNHLKNNNFFLNLKEIN